MAAAERAEFPRLQRPSSGPVEPAYDGKDRPVELRERALALQLLRELSWPKVTHRRGPDWTLLPF